MRFIASSPRKEDLTSMEYSSQFFFSEEGRPYLHGVLLAILLLRGRKTLPPWSTPRNSSSPRKEDLTSMEYSSQFFFSEEGRPYLHGVLLAILLLRGRKTLPPWSTPRNSSSPRKEDLTSMEYSSQFFFSEEGRPYLHGVLLAILLLRGRKTLPPWSTPRNSSSPRKEDLTSMEYSSQFFFSEEGRPYLHGVLLAILLLRGRKTLPPWSTPRNSSSPRKEDLTSMEYSSQFFFSEEGRPYLHGVLLAILLLRGRKTLPPWSTPRNSSSPRKEDLTSMEYSSQFFFSEEGRPYLHGVLLAILLLRGRKIYFLNEDK